jgi:(E)-4-hydroxy-3-methylbut-2-enyl-diphosphate synthase
MEELMDTLIHEVELLAKEKEAEGSGAPATSSSEGWEALPGQADAARGKEIPVLSNKH